MEKIIQHQDPFCSGAFILNPNQEGYVPFKDNSLIYLTQENNEGLKRQILKLIDESQFVLKICSFIITDKEVFNAILNKAKQHRTAIFILTQLDDSKLKNTSELSNYLTEEELKENTVQAHLYCIKTLYDNGVHVRAATTAHAKFIVSDRSIGFLTSANLTTPSLVLNTETGVYLNQTDAMDLDKLFDVIFQRGTRYRQYITATKKKNFIGQSDLNISKEQLPNTEHALIRYTYEQLTHNLYEEIVGMICLAEKYIYLSTYSIVGLENLPEFQDAITNAIARNIRIYVFCRGMNYRNDHLKACEWLNRAGCHIYADLYNHSKGIISESKGMIFTANIDGNHGLINGFEVGYILNEQQRMMMFELHKYLISSSVYIFTANPIRQHFFDTYSSYEKTKGISAPVFPQQISITMRSGLSVNHAELLERPVFYAQTKDQKFLQAGASLYKCNYHDGTFHLISKEIMKYDIEKYILKYFNLKIQFN
ncbi:phospholipase D-like domain-containing protein [Taibaiella chishuiensis]|uniref:phospholipase D n=1 Tax=Taibaiella chishuiensis TaxID=1434707 RepID=A0A2P8D4U1_9BACT|nr:phospholipase D-like domain-containing protein [Taibaiella chishuiensis]PSK92225.1 phosphatidylserine/phosphatidylglycerophosphate/cardiolipin synthase-like enzyme [Taibaiella chishuiensis]